MESVVFHISVKADIEVPTRNEILPLAVNLCPVKVCVDGFALDAIGSGKNGETNVVTHRLTNRGIAAASPKLADSVHGGEVGFGNRNRGERITVRMGRADSVKTFQFGTVVVDNLRNQVWHKVAELFGEPASPEAVYFFRRMLFCCDSEFKSLMCSLIPFQQTA